MNAQDIAERLMEHPEAPVEVYTRYPGDPVSEIEWNSEDHVWEVYA